jgi:hypothetical protein
MGVRCHLSISLCFYIWKKCKKINRVKTWVGEVSDVFITVVQWSIRASFRRNEDGALLINVTIVFKKKGNKSTNSGTMTVADPFGEPLVECGEDSCCVSSRDSCPGHGRCRVVRVTGVWQDAAAPSSTATAWWWHLGKSGVDGWSDDCDGAELDSRRWRWSVDYCGRLPLEVK